MRTDRGSGQDAAVASDVELEMLEEIALAMAQATIQNAMNSGEVSRTELARRMGRPKSFITRILRGTHNLTVRTLARAIGACGSELMLDRVDPVWTWRQDVELRTFEVDDFTEPKAA